MDQDDMAKRICTLPDCEKPHVARGLCRLHWKQQYGKPVRYLITCQACGVEHRSARQDGKYCSDWCKGWAYAEKAGNNALAIPVAHPAHPNYQYPEDRWFWTGRTCRVFYTHCAVCSTLFATPYTVSTCTPACAEIKYRADKREAKHRRRALERSAFVAPVRSYEIFERDAWRCQLCHRMVRRDVEVPHPLAPTIDHIIPLARGGTHEPANVQCAHFQCNSLKGDRGSGEQLLLIG